jgi:gluconolactonase
MERDVDAPAVTEHDRAFREVVSPSATVDLVLACDAHEGPVYVDPPAGSDGTGALYATSLPTPERRARLLRVELGPAPTVATLRTGAVMPNGMALGPDGRLVVCEQGDLAHDACITAIDPGSGDRTVLVDRWRGRRLNSPNDVAVAPDGAIWFTDPTYGHLQGFRPPPELAGFVHRVDPRTGAVDVVADGFDQPNGIALSPDGSTVYVTDSGVNQAAGSFHVERPHHVLAFDVLAGGRLGPRRLLAVTAPGFPDGIATDDAGRVYVSATDAVLVLAPDGALLGELHVPGAVNFAFGGPDRDVLYVTADRAVWSVRLRAAATWTRPPRSPLTHAHPNGTNGVRP